MTWRGGLPKRKQEDSCVGMDPVAAVLVRLGLAGILPYPGGGGMVMMQQEPPPWSRGEGKAFRSGGGKGLSLHPNWWEANERVSRLCQLCSSLLIPRRGSFSHM